jgi:hypothetical protein
MANIRLLKKEDMERVFAPVGKRVLREQEMMPFREAVSQLGADRPGGTIELEGDENPRMVMMRMHRAARDLNKNIRFQRHGKDQRELRFRLQTPEETARLKDRGRKLAQSRRTKRAS